MFGASRAPEQAKKRQAWSVWARYASNLLPVAAVLGAFGLPLLGLSFLAGQQMPNRTRGAALGDPTVAAIAALIGLGWRWRWRS